MTFVVCPSCGRSYSGANIVAIAFGALCMLLIVVGTLLATPGS